MTEEEARDWIRTRHGATALVRCEHLVSIVIAESVRQNLISAKSVGNVWARHIVDSAQLLGLKGVPDQGDWTDIGSGAGFPGLVVAILRDQPIRLVEPRRKRTIFLQDVADSLGLDRVDVITAKVEHVRGSARVLSARAVAPPARIFEMATHLATENTVWVLPRGRSAELELAEATQSWQGAFHVEHSITASDSKLVVATGVRRR